MKSKHRIIRVIIKSSLLLCAISSNVNASESDPVKVFESGLLEASEEDMDYWANVEKDDLMYANRTEAEALMGAEDLPIENSASWICTSRNFYYYAQEKSYSCGAACVRMILRNIKGTAYAESTIRTGCKISISGTTLSNMVTYTNSQQSYNRYVARYRQTKSMMCNDLYNGIVLWDTPPIIGLKESTSSGWRYNLAGHAVAVYAVKSDKSAFMISDPWAGYIGDSANRDSNKSASKLYDAYNAINGGYMF